MGSTLAALGMPHSTGLLGLQCSCRHLTSMSNRFRPQNLIGHVNSIRQQQTRTTHFNFESCRRSVALNASLPSSFLLCGGPETVERLLAAAKHGFQRSHTLYECYSTCPAFCSHRMQNQLFCAKKNFSGVEFCTGN